MIKIPSVDYVLKKERYMKRGSMRLIHWPNGHLGHFVKNMSGMTNIFDTRECGFPTKAAERFRKSTREDF